MVVVASLPAKKPLPESWVELKSTRPIAQMGGAHKAPTALHMQHMRSGSVFAVSARAARVDPCVLSHHCKKAEQQFC